MKIFVFLSSCFEVVCNEFFQKCGIKIKSNGVKAEEISAATPAQTLEEALHAGDAAQVKKLLEQGANPNTEISGGR